MLTYANPLDGVIHPEEWRRPAGNRDFRVTAKFGAIDDSHPTAHTGTDMGDGDPDADNVYAMEAGKVTMARTSDGCVGIAHSDGTTSYYCHLVLPHYVRVGQLVPRRQLIGHVGKTGTTVSHLHVERKIGSLHTDVWPWLEQNRTEDNMIPIPSGSFAHISNRVGKLTGAARFRAERRLDAPTLRIFPAGTVFTPSAQADDGSSAGGPTPTRWYGGFLYDDSPAGFMFGWIHSSLVALEPEAVVDCAPLVKAGRADEKAKTKAAAETAAVAAIRGV